MSQRELTPSEKTIGDCVLRRLRIRRKKLPIGPKWFLVDSALGLARLLHDERRSVDSLALSLAAIQIDAGNAEQVLEAMKQLCIDNGRAKQEEAEAEAKYIQDVKRGLEIAGVNAAAEFDPSVN